jgi:nicotinamidase-related amidase
MPTIRGLDKGQKPALLISECQRAIVDADAHSVAALPQQVQQRGILPRIAALAQCCRDHGVPVIHCTIEALPGFRGFSNNCLLAASMLKGGQLVEGNPMADITSVLTPQACDIVARRCHGMTAFHGTELESILRGLGVDTVIIAGVSTNIAIPGMCCEAVNRGFQVVIPEDCTAGGTAESHAFQIRNHLPFLATITDAASLGALLGEGTPG